MVGTNVFRDIKFSSKKQHEENNVYNVCMSNL